MRWHVVFHQHDFYRHIFVKIGRKRSLIIFTDSAVKEITKKY